MNILKKRLKNKKFGHSPDVLADVAIAAAANTRAGKEGLTSFLLFGPSIYRILHE